MYQAHRHRFFRGAKTSDVFNGVVKGFEFVFKFIDGNVSRDTFQNDLDGAFLRQVECVEVGEVALKESELVYVGGLYKYLAVGRSFCSQECWFEVGKFVDTRSGFTPVTGVHDYWWRSGCFR